MTLEVAFIRFWKSNWGVEIKLTFWTLNNNDDWRELILDLDLGVGNLMGRGFDLIELAVFEQVDLGFGVSKQAIGGIVGFLKFKLGLAHDLGNVSF